MRGCEFLSSLPCRRSPKATRLGEELEGGRRRRCFTLSPYGLWYAGRSGSEEPSGRSDSEESSDSMRSMNSMSSPPSVPSKERERCTASELVLSPPKGSPKDERGRFASTKNETASEKPDCCGNSHCVLCWRPAGLRPLAHEPSHPFSDRVHVRSCLCR